MESKMSNSAPLRLHFLDGVRGASALYIAIFHAFHLGGIVQADDRLGPSWLDRAVKAAYYVVFAYGYYAVPVFIVLSGYSLMLPVARSATGELEGGVRRYFWRRARRILPPYYAALVFSLFLIAVVPGMNTPGDCWWNSSLPALEWGPVLSHLLLVHNWHQGWIGAINQPMWSVAVEWQIYALLPAVLLPVRRRFGSVAMLGCGLLLAVAPRALFGPSPVGERFIGMFALGAFGACVGFSKDASLARWKRLPWKPIAGVCFAVFAAIMLASFRFWQRMPGARWFYIDRYAWTWGKDFLVAVGTLALIVHYAALAQTKSSEPVLMRAFGSRWGALLGRFSYSLYLTHAPVLTVVALACLAAGFGGAASYITLATVGMVLSVAVGYAFYWMFERPILEARRPVQAAQQAPAIAE